MTLYSNEIKNFLDKIYFYELSHRNDLNMPIYNYFENKLYNIDKLTKHTLSTTYPLSRDRLFGIVIGRLEFGYSFDGKNACVEYYVNRDYQDDWFDWMIKENKQEKTNNTINEYTDRNYSQNMHKETDKKKLYESIMCEVAKIVKKHICESLKK